jgi:hypothetical protein
MAKVKHKLTKIGFIFDDILNEDEIEELRKAGLNLFQIISLLQENFIM